MQLSVDKEFTQFMLLNSYILDSSGLMYGKAGIALSLYNIAYKTNDDLIEKHAFEFLREALAANTKMYSFASGKSGIAWTLLYLIDNNYLDADYQELYGVEHQSIINHIKKGNYNVSECLDYFIFIFASQQYVMEMNTLLSILSGIISDYYLHYRQNSIERNSFYYHSSKLLGVYCLIECSRPYLSKFVETIIDIYHSLSRELYLCDHLSFGTNLLWYGKDINCDEAISLANMTVDYIVTNFLKEQMNLKQTIDTLYNIDKLAAMGKDMEYHIIRKQLLDMLFYNEKTINQKSPLYIADRKTLSSLMEGIPRLSWLDKKCSTAREIIMLF